MCVHVGTCYIPSQLVGDNCDQLTPNGLALRNGYFFASTLDLIGLVLSVVLFVLLVNKARKMDQLAFTILFCAVGFVALAVYNLAEAITFARPAAMMTVDATGSKVTVVDTAQAVFAPIALCFGMMAVLQVSIVWISVAQAVERLRLVQRNQTGFTRGLYALYVVMMAVALACCFVGQYVYLTYLIIGIYLVLMPTFMCVCFCVCVCVRARASNLTRAKQDGATLKSAPY